MNLAEDRQNANKLKLFFKSLCSFLTKDAAHNKCLPRLKGNFIYEEHVKGF